VKRKEKELRELITALNEKNSNNNFKDKRITQLELTVEQMRKDAFNYEQKLEALQKDVKTWKEKLKVEAEEKEFYHWQALDAKRKNKLLKVAMSRINIDKEVVLPSIMPKAEAEKDTNTFITGTQLEEEVMNMDSIKQSQLLVEQNILENRKGVALLNKSTRSEPNVHKRTMS
jgi:coenzyme F420-reducing hydrogenase delta subunit